jgi:3-deoxy-D-arabino-heptulosonate 7-phosphate (DAHP) synthase
MDPNIQSLFDLLKEGLPLAREALKKIKDAKAAAAVESLDAFANNAMTQLFRTQPKGSVNKS